MTKIVKIKDLSPKLYYTFAKNAGINRIPPALSEMPHDRAIPPHRQLF